MVCCHCWVSRYRRSFEIVETPWRVRDKSHVVPDASSRPPPLADDFIARKTGTYKACAQRNCVVRANQLTYNLVPGHLLSNITLMS
jgi:hypothetical protein